MFGDNEGKLMPGTFNLLAIMVVIFLFGLVSDKIGFDFESNFYLFYPDSVYFKPWQLITHLFTHGGIAHILFNGLGLFMFGNIVEQELGTKKFLTIFFLSGFGSLLLHFGIAAFEIWQKYGHVFPIKTGLIKADLLNGPVCGASGALYGIIAAFALFFPNRKLIFLFIPYPIKAKYLVPVLVLLDLVFGILQVDGDVIAHFAHVGGAITGFLIIKFWFNNHLKRGW